MKLDLADRTMHFLSTLGASASRDRVKSMLVRTPAEAPLHALRTAWSLRQLRHRPELYAILTEDVVISQVLGSIIGEHACCVDVGCHVGSTLSKLLRLAPHGRHVAFEPIPVKAKWLRRRFPEVDVFEVALCNEVGEATFYVNTKRSGFSGLARHGERGEHEALKVRTERLDTMLAERHVDFLKIDVEGGELAVLEGATELLARCRPRLLFECTTSGLQAHGLAAEDVFGWLAQHGYSVWTPADFLTKRQPLDLERFIAAQTYPFQAFNFFAQTSD